MTTSPVAVTFETDSTHRPLGWQVQQRVDMVVSRVLITHRGRSEEDVARALQQSLRAMGVVPNHRQITMYAAQIADLPPLPPPPRPS